MDKSPDAFRTISEVADLLETPAHVLRFWESRFPQIKPVKRAGGRRYYRPADVALLTGIRKLLHDEGMTIRGVQKILREQGVRHVAGLSGDDVDPDLDDMAEAIGSADLSSSDGAEVVAIVDWVEKGAITESLQRSRAQDPARTEASPQQGSLFDLPVEPPAPVMAPVPTPSQIEAMGPASGHTLSAPPSADPGTQGDLAEPEVQAQRSDPLPKPLPEVMATADPAAAEGEAEAAKDPQTSAAAAPAVPEKTVEQPAAEMENESELGLRLCDQPWFPSLLRALAPDQRASRAVALAALLPRLQALQDRMQGARKTRNG